jgi:four helix bundle protein
MSIASKEARETNYWLRLIRDSKLLKDIEYDGYIEKCVEIIKILTSIVKTSQKNIRQK